MIRRRKSKIPHDISWTYIHTTCSVPPYLPVVALGAETPTSFPLGLDGDFSLHSHQPHGIQQLLNAFEQSGFHIRTERVMYDRVTDLL